MTRIEVVVGVLLLLIGAIITFKTGDIKNMGMVLLLLWLDYLLIKDVYKTRNRRK